MTNMFFRNLSGALIQLPQSHQMVYDFGYDGDT
jgi:hypothetical protein